MKIITVDEPPNPDDARFKGNPLSYNRAIYDWANKLKGKIEQASKQNDSPMKQNFVVTSFTTNTALTGTSTGTDISNFICTLVDSFVSKGIITTKTSTQ